MGPIFVYGTGRCGSTHVQRLIALHTDCWIWGEHDGILLPLLDAVRLYDASQALVANVFSQGWAADDRQIATIMQSGSGELAWLNRLRPNTMRNEVRQLIDRTFSSALPEGWTAWGFKEILYGLNNDVPAQLLGLFPDARATFSFRHPQVTIESMIRSWSPELLVDPAMAERLRSRWDELAQRWRTLTLYFLELQKQQPQRLVLAPAESLNDGAAWLFDALALPITKLPDDMISEPTNRGTTTLPDWAKVETDRLFAASAETLLEPYGQALAVCRAALGTEFSPVPAHRGQRATA
jgi:hypothetical protein